MSKKQLQAALGCELRPFEPTDMEFAWRLTCDSEVGRRWRYGGHIPAFEAFASEFWNDVLTHLIVVRSSQRQQPLGLVTLYGANFPHQHMYLAAVVAPGAWGRGAIAGLLGLEYAFTTWPVEKVYLETHEDNLQQFRSGIGKVFELEASLPRHQWYDERWVSKIILASYRSHYNDYIRSTLSRLRRSGQRGDLSIASNPERLPPLRLTVRDGASKGSLQ